MILFPAIDLKDGACVRLLQGDMDQSTVFNTSPADQAKIFESQGFEWLHLVDLNGAFEGKPVNKEAVESIINAIDLPIQLGGGIRTRAMIDQWLDAGITRVILGTAALKDPQLVIDACKAHPGRIVVGVDAKSGFVATEGWADSSHMTAIDLGKRFEDAGVAAIIYTDIGRDGLMKGPDIEGTGALADALSIPVIASGGISSNHDIKAVASLQPKGVIGTIIGRALYENAIDIDAALSLD